MKTVPDATVEVFVLFIQRCLIAVFYLWFNCYVSVCLGNIHNNYIVEYNFDSNVVFMLGSGLTDKNA